jgi:hypothetical protein
MAPSTPSVISMFSTAFAFAAAKNNMAAIKMFFDLNLLNFMSDTHWLR